MHLPSKCVECIINHINENDIKTLHSTILVNRDWCKFSVIRLWKSPLSFSKFNSNSKSRNKFYKVIPILLSFLDLKGIRDIKTSSKQFYIPKNTLNFYPKLQSDLKIPIHNLKIPTHPLSFEYPKFIKHVDIVDLVVLVNRWLNNLLSEMLSTTSVFLNFYLYKSLSRWEYLRYMTNSINFHCPFIHFDKNPQPFFKFILESLFQVLIKHSQIVSLSIMDTPVTHHLCNQLVHNNIGPFLSNLSYLDFCQTIDSRLLSKLSELIHNTITTISITMGSGVEGDVDDGIIDFTNSFNSLQSVSILGNNNNANITPIIQSLQNHTSTLITLKLNLCTVDDVVVKSLSNFHNLQELTFHQLHFTFDDDTSTITTNNFNFPHLKKLNYWEYSSADSLITWMIQNNGQNLTHLDIHTSMERCIKLFDIISKNCPFLLSLTTPISEQKDFITLFSILEHCNFLKTLYIYEFNIITINEQVILSFIKVIPNSLVYLKINKLEFSQFKLGCKLKNCTIISDVLLGKNSLAVKEFFSSLTDS